MVGVNDFVFKGKAADRLRKHLVCIRNGDMFGIFKAGENSSVKDVQAMVEAYLQLRMESWMDEYMPEEKPKLENAEVKVIGNYVMYCILSDADADTAFASFESCLSAK